MERNKYLGGLFGNTQYIPPSQKFKNPLQEETKIPSLEDLTPKAIRKELAKKVKSSWITTTSYALPIFVIFIALSLGMSLWNILSLIIGSISLIAIVRWVIPNFFLFDSFEKNYRKNLRALIDQRDEEKRMEVKTKLESLGMQQGADQFNELLETFNSLISVLGRKFNVTEMAYMKYYVISQQVLEAAMNNLLEITLIKTNLGSINPTTLKRRIKSLESSTDDIDKEEVKTLQERLELYDSESIKIERLLVENERAITQIVKTTKAISEVDTIDTAGKKKMDEAMLELRDAVQRLADYHLHEFENVPK
jgi:hypothetical protein